MAHVTDVKMLVDGSIVLTINEGQFDSRNKIAQAVQAHNQDSGLPQRHVFDRPIFGTRNFAAPTNSPFTGGFLKPPNALSNYKPWWHKDAKGFLGSNPSQQVQPGIRVNLPTPSTIAQSVLQDLQLEPKRTSIGDFGGIPDRSYGNDDQRQLELIQSKSSVKPGINSALHFGTWS